MLSRSSVTKGKCERKAMWMACDCLGKRMHRKYVL